MANRADVARIRQIFNQAVEQSVTAIEAQRRSLPEMVEWFERRSSRHPLLVAEMGQLVIGYGHLDPSIHGLDEMAQMSIKVDPRFDGREVEDFLMRELVATAERIGLHSVVSLVVSTDLAGIQRCRRLGFVRNGEMREVSYKFDQWLSAVLMQRLLARPRRVSAPPIRETLPGLV